MFSVSTGPMSLNAIKSKYCISGAPDPPSAWSEGRNCVTTVVSHSVETIASFILAERRKNPA